MKNIILYFCLLLALLFIFINSITIAEQGQKINELEKGVLYFSNEADKLRAEQDKQARLIATDLIIYANGYELGK